MDVDLSQGRCAIVAIDLQRVFTASDGPFANTGSGPMLDAVATLLAAGRAAGLPVIHSRYVVRDDLRDAGLLRGAPFVEDGHLSAGSPWARLDPRVPVAGDDVDTVHHRPSAFFQSDLDAVLRGLGVDRLILAGLSVNNAIAATARDAFARDLPSLVVREATGAAPFETDEDTAAAFRALAAWTAEVASLDDVLPRLAGSTA